MKCIIRTRLATRELGLVFAGIGLSTGVVGGDIYAAIVVVVILTTFIAPPLLRISFR